MTVFSFLTCNRQLDQFIGQFYTTYHIFILILIHVFFSSKLNILDIHAFSLTRVRVGRYIERELKNYYFLKGNANNF